MTEHEGDGCFGIFASLVFSLIFLAVIGAIVVILQ